MPRKKPKFRSSARNSAAAEICGPLWLSVFGNCNVSSMLLMCFAEGGLYLSQWHKLASTISQAQQETTVPCALPAMCALSVGNQLMSLGQSSSIYIIIYIIFCLLISSLTSIILSAIVFLHEPCADLWFSLWLETEWKHLWSAKLWIIINNDIRMVYNLQCRT